MKAIVTVERKLGISKFDLCLCKSHCHRWHCEMGERRHVAEVEHLFIKNGHQKCYISRSQSN
jgi:hypothetical protein